MRRRRLLATSGVALLGVGCLDAPLPSEGRDSTNGSTGTPSPNDEPMSTGVRTDEPTAIPSASVSIGDAGVYPGFVVVDDDALSVVDAGGQYLLVETRIDAEGEDESEGPAAEEFVLAVGGRDYAHEPPRSRLYWPELGDPMGEFGDWLLFSLPEAVDPGDARLRWPGGEWTPGDGIRDRLEAPLPSFEVSFEAPEAVGPDEEPSLTLSVRNVGERTGYCVLALNRVGPEIAYAPVREIAIECAPGETVTREYAAISPHEPVEPRSVTYHLVVANGDRLSRTINPAE